MLVAWGVPPQELECFCGFDAVKCQRSKLRVLYKQHALLCMWRYFLIFCRACNVIPVCCSSPHVLCHVFVIRSHKAPSSASCTASWRSAARAAPGFPWVWPTTRPFLWWVPADVACLRHGVGAHIFLRRGMLYSAIVAFASVFCGRWARQWERHRTLLH